MYCIILIELYCLLLGSDYVALNPENRMLFVSGLIEPAFSRK